VEVITPIYLFEALTSFFQSFSGFMKFEQFFSLGECKNVTEGTPRT
jgi:hypothetical protein